MRILVTNDDGIDGPGLHVLVRRLLELGAGEVVVVAPHREQSGMGAAVGPFHLDPVIVHEASIPGAAPDAVWAIEGPPALGVLMARLGAFGPPPDLVVSGINPGLNVGRSIYHSGTVGAALTARNGRITGVAVSQEADPAVRPHPQHWDTAAEVAATAVREIIDRPPDEAAVLNLNVPDRPIAELRGARFVPVGEVPVLRAVTAARQPLDGGRHQLVLEQAPPPDAETEPTAPPSPGLDTASAPTGQAEQPRVDDDTNIVGDGWVAMSWLGRIGHHDPGGHDVAAAFDRLLPPA